MAKKIIDLFPPKCKNPNKPTDSDNGYINYVEPFFGGGAVLFNNDPEGISEIANDINGVLINFFRVLQNDDAFDKFRRRIEATPFSNVEFEKAQCILADEDIQSDIERAWAFFVVCRQSLAGRTQGFTGITKTRTRRGMNNETSAWLTSIDGLQAVHERLKRVLILNRDAVDVICQQSGPRTLFYIDAPYVHESRSTTGEYAYEMTDNQHRKLIYALLECSGRFVVSMYHHPIYDDLHLKHGWNCHEFKLPNAAAGGKNKRIMTECIWSNYGD